MTKSLRFDVRTSNYRSAIVAIAAVVAIAVVWVAGKQLASPVQASTPEHIAVPAYFDSDSASTWSELDSASPGSVDFAVLNPDSGPGSVAELSSFATDVANTEAAGIKVIGYVDTGYLGTTGNTNDSGSNSISSWVAQDEQEINEYYSSFGSDFGGIFFDDVQNACGPSSNSNTWVDAYEELSAYVTTQHPGALTVDNPGTAVPQCYEDAADVLVTYEGSYKSYVDNGYTPLSWTPASPQQIFHIIYNTATETDMDNAIMLSNSRGAGYVYVTNANLPDPYDGLPSSSYFSAEQTDVLPNNSGSSSGSSAPATAAPLITSSTTVNFTLDETSSFAITTTGTPTPSITETGALPADLVFTDNGNGTATLSGTPMAIGKTVLDVTASNSISPSATQLLKVTVSSAKASTSKRHRRT